MRVRFKHLGLAGLGFRVECLGFEDHSLPLLVLLLLLLLRRLERRLRVLNLRGCNVGVRAVHLIGLWARASPWKKLRVCGLPETLDPKP